MIFQPELFNKNVQCVNNWKYKAEFSYYGAILKINALGRREVVFETLSSALQVSGLPGRQAAM